MVVSCHYYQDGDTIYTKEVGMGIPKMVMGFFYTKDCGMGIPKMLMMSFIPKMVA